MSIKMWNPFRRQNCDPRLPKPEWEPIQNLDSIDVFGQRKDGGIDLAIVVSQPLDDSPKTLKSIRHKVDTYLTAIGLEKFQAEMGYPPRDQTRILIVCNFPIHPVAMATIDDCKSLAKQAGIVLEVHESVASALKQSSIT